MSASREEPTVPVLLTPSETRLVLKLIEANDSGMIDRRGRLGGHKLRVGLAKKFYDAVDELPGSSAESDDEDGGGE